MRSAVFDLERRARTLSSSQLRHDVSNAVGAARNALQLLEEDPCSATAARFTEIARRNVALATQLLSESPFDDPRSSAPDGPGIPPSSRNERDDLGGTGEREHGNTLDF